MILSKLKGSSIHGHGGALQTYRRLRKNFKKSSKPLRTKPSTISIRILDVLNQADPENIDARKLRIKLLKTLAKEDYCLMSRNAWVYYINKDKKFVRSKKDK